MKKIHWSSDCARIIDGLKKELYDTKTWADNDKEINWYIKEGYSKEIQQLKQELETLTQANKELQDTVAQLRESRAQLEKDYAACVAKQVTIEIAPTPVTVTEPKRNEAKRRAKSHT